jgi:hypothetical protein
MNLDGTPSVMVAMGFATLKIFLRVSIWNGQCVLSHVHRSACTRLFGIVMGYYAGWQVQS